MGIATVPVEVVDAGPENKKAQRGGWAFRVSRDLSRVCERYPDRLEGCGRRAREVIPAAMEAEVRMSASEQNRLIMRRMRSCRADGGKRPDVQSCIETVSR